MKGAPGGAGAARPAATGRIFITHLSRWAGGQCHIPAC